jgi:hypothetical protein
VKAHVRFAPFTLAMPFLLAGWVGCAKQAAAPTPVESESRQELAAAGAVKKAAEQAPAPASTDLKAAGAADVMSTPRPGEELLKSARSRVEKCVGDHLEQLELDQYREGNLTVDIKAMDRVCRKAFDELYPETSQLLFLHKSLDEALFQARLLKDRYQRMKLYALRVGYDPAKNTKKLKEHWLAARKAAKAYSRAVEAWSKAENPPLTSEEPQRALMVKFLNKFSGRFSTYLAKPVKAKTAIYYAVADYLDRGLARMNTPVARLDEKGLSRLGDLRLVLDEARAFYKEFDKASKSKKDYAKKVRKAVRSLLKAVSTPR